MGENPAVQQAIQQALSEALGSIQRQLSEVQASFEQVKGKLQEAGSQETADRFAALLPPLMHMQAAGAALAASIETVLRFVGVSAQWTGIAAPVAVSAEAPAAVAAVEAEAAPEAKEAAVAEEVAEPAAEETVPAPAEEEVAPAAREEAVPAAAEEVAAPAATEEAAPAAVEEEVEAPAPAEPVDVDSLSAELQQLHTKAKRFAKVTVQELFLYKRDEVTRGRENRDLYQRFKDEIDRSKVLYDQRFEQIASHNIDYLYDELVSVLAENDPSALGDYPYPTPSGR